MNKSGIVVVGSSNTDMIIRCERLPGPGETVLGGEFLTAAGGKGANQAVAAARAGSKVSLVARIGRDPLGDQAIAGLSGNGVDVRHVTRDRHVPSGVALIFVGRNGENSIAVAGGANSRLSLGDVKKAQGLISRAQVLLMQLETPLATIAAAAQIGIKKGAIVILNPAPARPLPAELLRHVSILTPNESEAEQLTGIKLTSTSAARKAAEKLRRRGVQNVVFTLGARGALIANERGTQLVPGFEVRAVDTTAAGDVFNGALAVALSEGCSLEEAARFGNAAGALSVTRLGAQPSAPTRRAIEDFLKSY